MNLHPILDDPIQYHKENNLAYELDTSRFKLESVTAHITSNSVPEHLTKQVTVISDEDLATLSEEDLDHLSSG